ncbi:MAG TPA: MBL fold metallo-hydrolase [Gammaproteobacteria bacterium]
MMTLQFHGAAREVTGSCYLLQVGRLRLLIDCGLIQGTPADEARNRDPFPFDASQLDAVILSHAHLDHSGRLPLLLNAGFKGPIYSHRATRDLCRIMLRDAAYINEKEVEWTNKKRARKGLDSLQPLYTRRDADRTLRQFRSLEYGKQHALFPGMQMCLRDAGHILGSSIIELWIDHAGQQRKLVFSGDLGHEGAPILRNPEIIHEADLVVMESTYGDRNHRSWDDTWKELGEVLQEAHQSNGNVLFPSFAVGRTQDLLYLFRRHYTEWQMERWAIFLDSPLAIEATEIYLQHTDLYDADTKELDRRHGNPFMLPNLHISKTAPQSMAINRIRSGALIIAGSGMCDGGRIKHHLKHNVWRDNCHLIFVGFQARGTLGRRIVDGATHINLWGETVRVAAQVHTIGGLSAHADQGGLLRWYDHFKNRPRIALIHGEPLAIETLQQELQGRYAIEAVVPEPATQIDLANFRITHAAIKAVGGAAAAHEQRHAPPSAHGQGERRSGFDRRGGYSGKFSSRKRR